MTFRSIIALSCCLTLAGCAGGPRGFGGAPFGLLALGTGIAIGSVFTTLPHRHTVIDNRTYYSDGVFYRESDSPRGYTVITPSPGVWVDEIPEEHRVIRYKSQDYFTSKGVWYRFDVKRKRYKVVESPIEESSYED
ncbi:DUF6515 family protein [Marinomonas colpomeniae]|uniref:Beta-barrel assembly machine subunit BamE n=1 Tax=Marinomonas colpomeniae TaxID=2774408 RepID=A0ABR8P4W6_9GAMM|nr:DUF6515 family protein [Marinomonas colpomeniae]MBD5772473.1 hypothetical protein [Marinomonas colpomeniae]